MYLVHMYKVELPRTRTWYVCIPVCRSSTYRYRYIYIYIPVVPVYTCRLVRVCNRHYIYICIYIRTHTRTHTRARVYIVYIVPCTRYYVRVRCTYSTLYLVPCTLYKVRLEVRVYTSYKSGVALIVVLRSHVPPVTYSPPANGPVAISPPSLPRLDIKAQRARSNHHHHHHHHCQTAETAKSSCG